MIIACNGLKWPVEAVQRCRFNKLALGSLVVRLIWRYVSWTDHHLSDILEGTGERATNCVSYLPVCSLLPDRNSSPFVAARCVYLSLTRFALRTPSSLSARRRAYMRRVIEVISRKMRVRPLASGRTKLATGSLLRTVCYWRPAKFESPGDRPTKHFLSLSFVISLAEKSL